MRMATTKPSGRRGAAAVEFAMVFLLFLLPMILGLWEVSRLVEAKQLVVNAAREAGRAASTGTRSATEVQQTLGNYLTRNGVSTSGMSFAMENLTNSARNDPRDAEQLDRFLLTARVPYANLNYYSAISQLLGVTEITASVQWYSMKDIPVTVDPSVPID